MTKQHLSCQRKKSYITATKHSTALFTTSLTFPPCQFFIALQTRTPLGTKFLCHQQNVVCVAALHRWITAFLWLILTHTSIRDVIDKQHYSVDMLLAVVVTTGVWNALDWVYPASQPLPAHLPGTKPDKPHPLVLALIAVALLVAGIIVIGGNC